jgi:predicted permease
LSILDAIAITAPLFALILLGWGLVRHARWPQAVAEALGRYVFGIAVPAMLLNLTSDLARLPPLDPRVLVAYFGACLLAFGALRFGGQRLFDYDGVAASVFGSATTYGNIVLLGLPLAGTVLGEPGLATATPILALNSIALWGLATISVEWARGAGFSLAGLAAVGRGFLGNPLIIAMLAGLAISLTGWQLPKPVRATLVLLQQSAVPLALVTMGMGLAAYRISSGLREALVMSVAKLLMLPLLAWSLARLLGLSTLDGQTVVLLASVPMGVNSYLISRRFGALEGPVSTAMLVSTLASAGLTPLLIVVLRRLEG